MSRSGVVATALVIGVLACAWWTDSTACPVALLFGIPCPGCGLGRATLSLVRGHPIEALRFHPLVFVVLPAVVLLTLAPTRFVTAVDVVGFVSFPPTRPRRSPPRGEPPGPPTPPRRASARASFARLVFRQRGATGNLRAASQNLSAGGLRSLCFSTTAVAAVLLIAVLGVWIARFGGAFGGPVPVRSAFRAAR